MYIFEIVIPGVWLDYEDREWAFKTQGQLDFLKSHFFTANAALNLFVNAQSIEPSFPTSDSWLRDSQRRSEIQSDIERERGRCGSREAFEKIRIETDIRFKREKWSNGSKPREFEHGLSFIYARAFLYALDAFDKFLGVLAKQEHIPDQVSKLQAQFLAAFPNLRQVRNTAQHLEDRSRGLGVGRKELELKPISNGAIHAPKWWGVGIRKPY